MITIQALFVVAVLGYHYHSLGFTIRDERSITVSFDRSGDLPPLDIAFDRVVTSLEKTASRLCHRVGCIPETKNGSDIIADSIRRMINKNRDSSYQSLYSKYYSRPFTGGSQMDKSINIEWFQNIDTKSRNLFNDSIIEVYALRFGRIQPRSSCSFTENVEKHNKSDMLHLHSCAFTTTFPLEDLASLSTGNTPKTIEYWCLKAEDLFNKQLFDHAEGVAYMVIKAIRGAHIDFENDEYVTRLLVLLAELSKEKGYLDTSLYFGMEAIDFYSIFSHVKTILQRLRVLLTVPPIPPTMIDARSQRQNIILDLNNFIEDFKEDNITLTLQVFVIFIYVITNYQLTFTYVILLYYEW